MNRAILTRTALLSSFFLIHPTFSRAANRDMIELQRDVAQLQDQVRDLQRSFDERFAALQVLVQQSLDASNKSANAVQDQSRGLTDRVVGPVVGLSSKMDQVSNDVSAMRESVNDVTARMNKLEQQITDMNNTVKAISVPAVAPPPTGNFPPGGSTGGSAPPQDTGVAPQSGVAPQGGGTTSGGAPPVGASTLYDNAFRDYQSGKADLALSEFQDYVRFYHDTDAAPAAQYYIGQIHYSQSQFDQAIQDFDRVLEQYPTNSKTPNAHYAKGKTLFQLGRRNEAAKEFEAVVNEFPNSDVAQNARAQLRVLGINPGGARKKRTT